MMIQDFKIKHLEAFVGQAMNKSVSIIQIDIDPDIYIETDINDEYIRGSDSQRCRVIYSEHGENFGKEMHEAFFTWLCEEEEFIEGWF